MTAAQGFSLRLLAQSDIPRAMRLKDEAGWNQTAEDWQRFLAAGPQGCFAAVVDGGLVGTATTIVYDGTVAWISMLLVDPRYRGAGIGKALLGAAMAHLEKLGVPTIKLDATPQGRPIYARLGFVEEYELERWTLRRPEAAVVSPSASGAIVEGLDDIARLDRDAFGADRGGLVSSMAAAAPELVVQARRGGALDGFALGRHGSHADQLGPLVARDAATARQLLDDFLHRSRRGEVYVDRFSTHPWAQSVLLARDFQPSRPLTRMYRGTNDSPGVPEWQCAIMGPEYG
jgi:GNAT superfamily N-acetyltransferase